eukprot:GHVR01129625.1.p1 GENE.GHVR01129625.1~~GHVR01129625.1.p1  ORF type:complete len:240 (+),score=36.05 GHVR01129625.1:607-1326(+)
MHMVEERCSELGDHIELLSFGPLASIEGGDDMMYPKIHSMVQANVGNAIGVLYMLTLVQYGRMFGPRETGDSMSPCRQLVGYVCPRASPMSSSAGCHICMSSGVFVSTNCRDARREIYDRLKMITKDSPPLSAADDKECMIWITHLLSGHSLSGVSGVCIDSDEVRSMSYRHIVRLLIVVWCYSRKRAVEGRPEEVPSAFYSPSTNIFMHVNIYACVYACVYIYKYIYTSVCIYKGKTK